MPIESAFIQQNLSYDMVTDVLTQVESSGRFSFTPEPLNNYTTQVDHLLSSDRSGQGGHTLNQRLEIARLPVVQFIIRVDDSSYRGTLYGSNSQLIIEDSFLTDISDRYQKLYHKAKAQAKIGAALKWLNKTRRIDPTYKANQVTEVEKAILSSIQTAKVVGMLLGFGGYSYLNLFLLERYLVYPNWSNIIIASQILIFLIFLVFLALSLRIKIKIAPRFIRYHSLLRWGYFATIQMIPFSIASLFIMSVFYVEEMAVLMEALSFLWK